MTTRGPWGPPFVGDDAAYFFSINRNKRSIVLDFKDPNDLVTAKEIIECADVVIENFIPGVMDDLGLRYEAARQNNPRLVYCSMPAFTNERLRDMPGYDLMMQGITGFMSITGEEGGPPVKMGVALADIVAGLYASTAVSAALRQREQEGIGRRIEWGFSMPVSPRLPTRHRTFS